jgi:thiamine-monophosphate kinase
LLSMSLDDPSWWLPGLEEGFVAAVAAMAPHAALVGGDTTRAEAGRVVLSATFFGATDAAVSRAGARPGDDVWVDGPLGWAAAGLEALRRGEADAAGLEELVRAHRRPALHRGAGPVRGARAAIDVSDGLAADLTHVARASGVALEVRLPLPGHEALEAVGRRWGLDPVAWQLGGGDDYVRVAVGERPHGRTWTHVGTARADGPPLTVLGADGSRTTLGPAGYRHFPT